MASLEPPELYIKTVSQNKQKKSAKHSKEAQLLGPIKKGYTRGKEKHTSLNAAPKEHGIAGMNAP